MEEKAKILSFMDLKSGDAILIESVSEFAEQTIALAEEKLKNYGMDYEIIDYLGDDDRFIVKMKK